jgi:hypothetical protein
MEDDEKKEEKGDDHDCRQIEDAGDLSKELGEKKLRPKAKD